MCTWICACVSIWDGCIYMGRCDYLDVDVYIRVCVHVTVCMHVEGRLWMGMSICALLCTSSCIRVYMCEVCVHPEVYVCSSC